MFLLALVFVGWWVQSQDKVATFRISGSTSLFGIASSDGHLWFVVARSTRPTWATVLPSIEVKVFNASRLDANGNLRRYPVQENLDVDVGAATWRPWGQAQFYAVSYMSAILPLTLLSAYLLLMKQRPKNPRPAIVCDLLAIVTASTLFFAADHPWNQAELYVVWLSAILMLILLSAYLLLSKPRKSLQNRLAEPNPEKVA